RKTGRRHISQNQIALLDSLDFCWDPFAAQWNKKFEELKAYAKVHGHCDVPAQSGSLGGWCSKVRTDRKNGKLTAEQIAQLNEIGFCWDPHADDWNKFVAELIAFKEINGDFNDIPKSHLLSGRISNIRNRRKKGKISQERIAQLDALGFWWDYD